MKHLFNYVMLATVAAAAFISCAKEQNVPEENTTPAMKTITITTEVLTKSTLDAGHENLVWSTGDKISVFNDVDNTNTSLTYSAGGHMTVEVPAGTTEIYGHYPYYNGNTSGPSSVSIHINKNQTQKNPGELDGYYYPMVAKGTVTGDNKANMIFYPVAAALAINLYNTELAGTEKVSKVVVTPTANTNYIAGQNTNITSDGVQYTTAASSDPITVTLTNPLTLGNTKPANPQTFDGQIYACLAKQSYTAVNFEITTDKGVYSITSNATAIDCVNNDFYPINIDLKKASFTPNLTEPTAVTGWYRVEDASWLVAGDRVAIVANGNNYAMSPVQQEKYRERVAITKGTDGDYTTLSSYAGIQEFILETGTEAESFGFWCDNGANANKYIYASSNSSNDLKSQDALDANASFTIVSTGGGAVLVTAQGTNTRNILKYNDTNTRFSCYASGQLDIAIYKYYGGVTPTCVAPTINQEGNTITLSSTTPGATIYFTTDGSDPNPANEGQKYTSSFSIASSVTVKAIAVRSHYTNSGISTQACTPQVATPVIACNGTSFTISCVTDGASIYYTTSTTDLASVPDPTSSSTSYSAAVSISQTTYVKAIAYKDGYTTSAIASATCEYSDGGSFTPFNVWEDAFSTCSLSSTALSSLTGSTTGFTSSYSGFTKVYPMDGAIRIGGASATGSITTPVLSTIEGSSASLTITFKAAGWNNKTAKITISASKGSVTEGQTTIASEATMSGTSPTMTGSSCTFHVTGADNTTTITFSTTCSIGIDDLVITQTAK